MFRVLFGLRLLPVAVLVAVLSTGCGRDLADATVDDSVANYPCPLLTHSQAEAALGRTIHPPRGNIPDTGIRWVPGMVYCHYQAADDAGSFMFLGVASTYPKEAFEKFEQQNQASNLQPVPELATKALWDPTFHKMVVLTGDKVLALLLASSDPYLPYRQERTKRLVSEALERLE